MLLNKYFISILFCLVITKINAQKVQNFEIISAKTDKTYFNLIQYDDKLYIGTNIGAIIIDKNLMEANILSDQKGYILIENNKIIGNKLSAESNPKDNQYNYLLPEKYKNSPSRATIFNKHLYIINNGILFEFKQNNFSTSFDSLSVRAITKNYIGSYQGIFNKGVKLKYPEFTDGNIREFENETFICYGGLFRDSSGVITIFNNITNGEVKIANEELGSARDIIKLDDGNYALATNLGIYIINFTRNTVKTVLASKTKYEYFSIYQLVKDKNYNDRFYYVENNKIYNYVVPTNNKILILDTKKNSLIKDIYSNNLSNLYVLFEDKLIKYTSNNKTNQYEETTLIENLSFSHNLTKLNDRLFIITNVGSHVYDLKTNKSYLNIIPIETNRRSLFLIDDSIKFGTTNGIISLTEDDINNLIEERDAQPINNYNFSSQLKNYIIYGLIILILILLIIGYKIYNKKTAIIRDIAPDNSITKENIVQFIHSNITNVTILSICEKFGITPVRLYELLEDDKPGEIIRKHRLNLVRRYRREKKEESFIAENTGFSISYLKKIY